jgi:Mitochondrial carrier protein
MSASILRNEGPQGFFKGLMAPLVSITIMNTVTFASYSWLRPRLGAHSGWDWRNALAATLTGPVLLPISTAEGLVRVSLTTKTNDR